MSNFSDIFESSDSDSVTFYANTTAADAWMREVVGENEITFRLPEAAESARALREEAEKAGLSIAEV